MSKRPSFIAHVRRGSDYCQSLDAHLRGVAKLAHEFAAKFRLSTQAELVGLLHDLGKYSADFQAYIQSATELLNQDEDEEFVDAAGLKGTIDHSTSGAQFIWQHMASKDKLAKVAGEVLALCVASHHSGLIDCLTSVPGKPTEDGFAKRMAKPDAKTHLKEALEKANPEILTEARCLLERPETLSALQEWVQSLLGHAPGATPQEKATGQVFSIQIDLPPIAVPLIRQEVRLLG